MIDVDRAASSNPFARRRRAVLWSPRSVVSALRPQRRTARLSSTIAYLLLDVAGTPCALAQSEVREVLPLPHLHRPPTAGSMLAGFVDLGGVSLPVLDLARLLGLREAEPAPDPYRHLLLAADRGAVLLVDRVQDLVRVSPEAIRPVDGAETLNGCVVAGIAIGGGLVHVLAMARILTARERGRVAELTAREAARLADLTVA